MRISSCFTVSLGNQVVCHQNTSHNSVYTCLESSSALFWFDTTTCYSRHVLLLAIILFLPSPSCQPHMLNQQTCLVKSSFARLQLLLGTLSLADITHQVVYFKRVQTCWTDLRMLCACNRIKIS